MPQSPIALNTVNPSGALAPQRVDAQGTLLSSNGGSTTRLNVAAATVIKATPGRVCRVNVITAGSTPGTVNDVATTGAAAIANQVATLPNTQGNYDIQFPCAVAIVIVPGTGQVVAVSYI